MVLASVATDVRVAGPGDVDTADTARQVTRALNLKLHNRGCYSRASLTAGHNGQRAAGPGGVMAPGRGKGHWASLQGPPSTQHWLCRGLDQAWCPPASAGGRLCLWGQV